MSFFDYLILRFDEVGGILPLPLDLNDDTFIGTILYLIFLIVYVSIGTVLSFLVLYGLTRLFFSFLFFLLQLPDSLEELKKILTAKKIDEAKQDFLKK